MVRRIQVSLISIVECLSTSRVCQWDSSLVGLIFVSKEFEIDEQDRLANNLLSEWNTYLIGDVWGYKILSKDDEQVDALCGIYEYEALKWLKPKLIGK